MGCSVAQRVQCSSEGTAELKKKGCSEAWQGHSRALCSAVQCSALLSSMQCSSRVQRN